jgi:N-acetyl-anhydromuramyl-L-alanine amidase AmpD
MRHIDLIVIHCSATRCDQSFTVKKLTDCHNERFHNQGIGYHYYITRDGHIHPTRPEEVPGIHASGYNAHSIGVCYEGGYNTKGKADDTRTPEQRAALIALLRSLKEDYPEADIRGHRELKGVHKDCPCFDCQEYRDYFATLQK